MALFSALVASQAHVQSADIGLKCTVNVIGAHPWSKAITFGVRFCSRFG
jgi:hypothetical protein